MKNKTMSTHELTNFHQGRRLAGEDWLGGDHTQRSARTTDSFDLPVEGELLIDEADSFQIFLLRGESSRTKFPPELAGVSGLDHSHACIRKPYFMFRAPRLAKALRQIHQLQFLRHSRFQKGSADAVSLPADSNTLICASQSARSMGFWLWRYSATRLRSAARLCSMVTAPMDMG